MIHQTNNIDEIVNLLISGEAVVVKNKYKTAVKKKLREIKKNCTIVLSQLKEQDNESNFKKNQIRIIRRCKKCGFGFKKLKPYLESV